MNLFDELMDKGGFTIDTSNPTRTLSGFSVGGAQGVMVFTVSQSLDERDRFNHFVGSFGPNRTLGGWIDRETDKVYVEEVTIVDTLSDAMSLGLERNEIAIYNLDTGEEVRL